MVIMPREEEATKGKALEEPMIICYGRTYLRGLQDDLAKNSEDWKKEFIASLKRAFEGHKDEFISLDSNPNGRKYQICSIAWAIDEGLLEHTHTNNYTQSEVYRFSLTEKGKKEILGE